MIRTILLFVLVPLIALLIIVVFSVQMFLGSIVRNRVNRQAPEITQTRVVLDGAKISPLTGHGTLTGLVVGNPKGWSDGNVFTLEKIELDVAPSSIWGDHVIVNELTIEAPKFNYETRLIASNVGDLLKNIDQATGGGHEPAPSAPNQAKPIKIEIRHLLLRNGSVTVAVGPKVVTVPLPTVELKDIGTGTGGVTPGQLSVAVLKSVTPTLVSTATEALGSAIPGNAGDTVKQAGQLLKGLLDGKK